jgi:hypothetical protein
MLLTVYLNFQRAVACNVTDSLLSLSVFKDSSIPAKVSNNITMIHNVIAENVFGSYSDRQRSISHFYHFQRKIRSLSIWNGEVADEIYPSVVAFLHYLNTV